MDYRLSWINHWSEERESTDPRVIIRYTKVDYDQIEHEYFYYFMADNDEHAKSKALEFIKQSGEEIEIFSVMNRKTKEVILTEEDQ